MITWNATKEEFKLIQKIVDRAEKLLPIDRTSTMMDLEACHCNGNPLDFKLLLGFPDFDFAHDICGIARHMDRETGQLKDCFSPRCTKRESSTQKTN